MRNKSEEVVDTWAKETILKMWGAIQEAKVHVRENKEQLYSELLSLYCKDEIRFRTAYRIIVVDRHQPDVNKTINLVKENNVNNELFDYLCDVYILLNDFVPFNRYMAELLREYPYFGDCWPYNEFQTKHFLKTDFSKLDILEEYKVLPETMASYISDGMRFLFYNFFKKEYAPNYL